MTTPSQELIDTIQYPHLTEFRDAARRYEESERKVRDVIEKILTLRGLSIYDEVFCECKIPNTQRGDHDTCYLTDWEEAFSSIHDADPMIAVHRCAFCGGALDIPGR